MTPPSSPAAPDASGRPDRRRTSRGWRAPAVAALLLAIGPASGCRRAETPAPTPAGEATAEAATPAETEAAAVEAGPAPYEPAPADPGADAAAGAAGGADATAVALDELTQALRKYSAEKQRVPGSFAELVSAGYVKSLPVAPAGKKFAINSQRVEVILVND